MAASIDDDPLSVATFSYPLDVQSNFQNGHYMLFYVNVQNKTKYKYKSPSGVNIGDYGRLSSNDTLLDLLEEIQKKSEINRYRISSIEPNLLTEKIINLIKNSDKFLPHFHIPLQSGNDKILKLMKRKYNTKIYRQKIEMIRSTIPEACIGADVIVGFPNESSNDFLETFNFIESLDINYLHVFSYSDRTDTLASNMKNQVLNDEKILRSRSLHKLSDSMRYNFYKSNIGKVKKVLFETKVEDGYIVGFSENYIRVKVKGDKKMLNKIFNVKLLFIENDKIIGEIYWLINHL